MLASLKPVARLHGFCVICIHTGATTSALSAVREWPMKRLPKFLLSAAMVATMATSFSAVMAATPPDTLVQAWQSDDIISLDPAEVFELSASEILGNTYERLITYDIKDVSKISGQ